MLWCPVCKTEYREGFTVCSDCGTVLVTEVKADAENDKHEKSASVQNNRFSGEVLLANIKLYKHFKYFVLKQGRSLDARLNQ